jgi:hypothetical protein
MFAVLDEHATPLTDELLEAMARQARTLPLVDSVNFWRDPSLTTWKGLVRTAPKSAADRRRQEFLQEWHATLQELRDIGARISSDDHRPRWISESSPAGAQADQFLHAHYYQHTFDGRKANYAAFYEKNKNRRGDAVAETIAWWRNLNAAPSNEDVMLNITAPFLRAALTRERLKQMTYEDFRSVCDSVHAIRDYARRVPNRAVGLPDNGSNYTIPQKVAALSMRIWNDRSSGGANVTELIEYVLYGGPESQLPERLWEGVANPKWKVDGLGVSALGELVGWALPDRFPPRNGRTSKALQSLGYSVTVHV